MPLVYVAWRTAPPMVSGMEGVPLAVTTATASLKVRVMSRSRVPAVAL